ncbi:DUF2079 domain-containing protein [Patulibacter brassicae]|uniref:DUF2079 domain-containing protein n=1 Tax=Patulibacter brassicae TaxID=1705717 RepID=A0ABU4VGR0_9ACTN|nr:DUF2079 domain-containing protein [Patulibacter brassicae]MDX8150334.1 DUF2079 domain-containing protein [Patulibacter brassicae]
MPADPSAPPAEAGSAGAHRGAPALVARARAAASDRGLLVVLAAAALLALAYAVWSWQRHRWYLTAGYDLGIFDEAAWHLSRLEAPASSLREVPSLWGDHFHPIIVLWGVARAVWPSPVALLVVQALVVAGALVPLYLFARPRIGAPAAVLLALTFGTSWGVQRAIDFDVHEVAFGPVLLFAAVLAADRRRWGWYWAATLGLLCVKEDVALIVAAVGAWLLLDGRRRAGAATLLLGIAWFAAATRWWIPELADGREFSYWSYHRFGEDLPAALGHIALHPWSPVTVALDDPVKRETLALTLVAFCVVVPWLSRMAVIAIPAIAARFLSDSEVYWGNTYHYSLMTFAALAVAAVGGLQAIDRFWAMRQQRARGPRDDDRPALDRAPDADARSAAVAVAGRPSARADGAAARARARRGPRRLRDVRAATALAAVGLVLGTASWFVVFGSHGNVGEPPLWSMARLQPPPRNVDRELLDRVVAAVPRSGSIAAPPPLQPHLTGRGQAVSVLASRLRGETLHARTADNVVLDLSGTDAFEGGPGDLLAALRAVRERLAAGDLVPVAMPGQGWVVLRDARAPGGAQRPAADAPLRGGAARSLRDAAGRWTASVRGVLAPCAVAACGPPQRQVVAAATARLRRAVERAVAVAGPGCAGLLRDASATTGETVGRLLGHAADPAAATPRLALGAALGAGMLDAVDRATVACTAGVAPPAPPPAVP